MSHIITERCIGEVYALCQQVCPADCIHFVDVTPAGLPIVGQPTMVIDPDDCIDCSACLPECPVVAIVHDEDVDVAATAWNRQLAPLNRGNRPPVVRPRKDPPKRTV